MTPAELEQRVATFTEVMLRHGSFPNTETLLLACVLSQATRKSQPTTVGSNDREAAALYQRALTKHNEQRYEDTHGPTLDTLRKRMTVEVEPSIQSWIDWASAKMPLTMRAEAKKLVDNAARYEFLRARAVRSDTFSRVGEAKHWHIGFLAEDGGLSFDQAVDKARRPREQPAAG